MISVGNSMTTILKVSNNTGDLINNVEFEFNESSKTNLKNIKSNTNKQTGISTTYDVSNLKMKINDSEKDYLIKEKIDRGFCKTISIKINSGEDSNYDIEICED